MQRLIPITTLLACISLGAQAQDTLQVRNTIWASPAEAFYKQQVGYERLLNDSYGVGIQAANYTGFRGEYKGWNLTVLGRRYLKFRSPALRKQAPFGLYYQVHAAVYQHDQHLSLSPKRGSRTSEGIDYWWRGRGAGAGLGLGYRAPILKKASHNHLSVDVMVGARAYSWPKPRYDKTQYEDLSLLGSDFSWAVAGPGSYIHGLLAVGYSF